MAPFVMVVLIACGVPRLLQVWFVLHGWQGIVMDVWCGWCVCDDLCLCCLNTKHGGCVGEWRVMVGDHEAASLAL